jgi:hypothetical protein
MRLRLVLALVASMVVLVAASTTSSRAATTGAWYWSPGLCKSDLQRYGMRINDGRAFRIAQALCVGKGGLGSCEWNANHSKRLYNHFVAFARSPDGVVRGFDLYPTNRSSYQAAKIELASSFRVTASRFLSLYGPIASSLARVELEKGCAAYRG